MDFERRFSNHSHRTMMIQVAPHGIELHRLLTALVCAQGFLRGVSADPASYLNRPKSYFGCLTEIAMNTFSMLNCGRPSSREVIGRRTVDPSLSHTRVRMRKRVGGPLGCHKNPCITTIDAATRRTTSPTFVVFTQIATPNGGAEIVTAGP